MDLPELYAVVFTLASYLAPPQSSIRIFSDNVTTVQSLRKSGSTASILVSQLVENIHVLFVKKEISLDPQRIPGSLNVLADALSRNVALLGEWELHPQDTLKIL